MSDKEKNRKIRLLVRRLNADRKKLAKQVDILCNDMIAAHRGFVDTVNRLAFEADFYESTIGAADADSLFYTAGQFIRERLGEPNVIFFVRDGDKFEVYAFEGDAEQDQPQSPRECFSAEFARTVAVANQVCDLERLLGMGLQASPALLNKICAVTVPLCLGGNSQGFIVLWRPGRSRFCDQHLDCLCAVSSGLCRAIQSCMHHAHSMS